VLMVRDDLGPNGLAFSPTKRPLSEWPLWWRLPGKPGSGYAGIWQYDVQADDSVTNGRVFVDMSADKSPGGPDGMKVDRAGNVYDTGPGGIWVMAPSGKHIGTIRTPNGNSDRATNLAFGDSDYKTLYITYRLSLLKVRLNSAGIAPGPAPN